MHSCNIFNPLLMDPASTGADKLCIVSGYATPGMATWHIQKLFEHDLPPIDINLIVGMCGYDGLALSAHLGFLDIIDTYNLLPGYSQFNCQYVYRGFPVHSKLYVWLKNDDPVLAFAGSANYTQTAFSSRRREVVFECDPVSAYEYYNQIEPDTVYCTYNEIEECIQLNRRQQILDFESGEAVDQAPGHGVTLSLLTSRTGEVGTRSGLNWGQRPGREPNQAYIHLPRHIARSGFFPLNRQHFTVLTDDGRSLVLRVEQQNDKAITTPENNSRLGEYFRNRLGLANGAYVTRADLDRYGRTDVTFYKFDDEQFFMDFSV